MLLPSSPRCADTRESREASASRRTASEMRAGDWNSLGIESAVRVAEGEEVKSCRGLRTMRGGARLKQTSWPIIVGLLTNPL